MLLPRPLAIFANQRACLKTFVNHFLLVLRTKFMHQTIETPPPPNPRCIARDSGDLTRPVRGFKIHFTTCCPWEAVELTRCLFYPGRKRGFDGHAFLEAGTASSSCLRALFEGINSLWDSWICRSLQKPFHCIFKPCWVWYAVLW